MTSRTADRSMDRTARVAGLFFLVMAVCAGFAHFYSRLSLIVPGDAAATARNVMASEGLFRMGFVSDLVAQVSFLVSVLALYKLFAPVGKGQAVLMAVIALVGVPITALNLSNQYAALLILSGADYLTVFSTEQLQALVLLFLTLHDTGYGIAHVFFGLWLLPLGCLVLKAAFIPRVLGYMLVLAAFGYLVGTFASFLFPRYATVIQPIYIQPALAEMSFCLWLLVRGARPPTSTVN